MANIRLVCFYDCLGNPPLSFYLQSYLFSEANMNRNDIAFKVMNFCRQVAVMSQEEWLAEYRLKFTPNDKGKLVTIPYITKQPITCEFPWATNNFISQERTPPIAEALPQLPEPQAPDMQEENFNVVRNRRRPRTANEEDEYVAPRNHRRLQETEELPVAPRLQKK